MASGGIAGAGPGTNSYSMYSNSPYSQPNTGATLSNRYVSYDAHTNQPVAVHMSPGNFSSPTSIPAAPAAAVYPNSLSSPGVMSNIPLQQQQPTVFVPPPPNTNIFPPSAVPQQQQQSSLQPQINIIPPGPPNTNSGGGISVKNQFQPLVKVFNPANETGEVVSLSSDSKAIL